MSNIKLTFLFELTTITKGTTVIPGRETGWSETLVTQAGSVGDPILAQFANGYAQRRMPLLANQGKLIGYRFHSLDNNSTRAFPLGAPWTGTGGDCTMPQVALLARLYCRNGINNRALELRGVPASLVTTGEYVPGGIAPGILSSFFQYICQNFGMLGVDKGFPHFGVTSISAGGVAALSEDQTGIGVGDTVRFYRTRYDSTCCGSVGTYKVTAAAARSLTLDHYFPAENATGGKVAKWTKPTYLQFDNSSTTGVGANGWGLQRSVIRKSGRPFDLFSGRRSRTCCKC